MNQQMQLFDNGYTLAPSVPVATSEAAAKAIQPTASTLRERVYECILKAGDEGRTDIEIQELLGMPGDTERPRRRELETAGRITQKRVDGEVFTRKTNKGRQAVVWVSANQERQ